MEENSNREEAMSVIRRIIHQKGYRVKFAIGSRVQPVTADLDSCLRAFFDAYDNGKYRDGKFELETNLPYEPRISCRFYMRYDREKGFRITRFFVSNQKMHKHRTFDLHNNNQLPGSQMVYTLFPKPKPWDDIMKGRFRR